MRKTISAVLAVAAMAGGAQPAIAAPGDNPNARFETHPEDEGGGTTQYCFTPRTLGKKGQYGAWGNYIAGCTVRLPCPASATACAVEGGALISTRSQPVRMSLNQRIRTFRSGRVTRHEDDSCEFARTTTCTTYERGISIAPGEQASLQCNGVRATPTGGIQDTVASLTELKCWITVKPLP